MQIRIQVLRGPERPRNRRRGLMLAAVVAAAIATPVAFAAVKTDVFSDVPSTAADHDAINRVYNAGIMHQCATSPSLMFCPNQQTIRRGAARQYDYALGLSGTPGAFTPSFRHVDVKTGGGTPPFTVDSTMKVTNLNADTLDGHDSSEFLAASGGAAFATAEAEFDGISTSPMLIRHLDELPAGNYVFVATFVANLSDGSATCTIDVSTPPSFTATVGTTIHNVPVAGPNLDPVAFDGIAADLGAGSSAGLSCSTSAGVASFNVLHARLVAFKLGSLSMQP